MNINLNPEDMRLIVKALEQRRSRTENPSEIERLNVLIGRFAREIDIDPVKRKRAYATSKRLHRERDYNKRM